MPASGEFDPRRAAASSEKVALLPCQREAGERHGTRGLFAYVRTVTAPTPMSITELHRRIRRALVASCVPLTVAPIIQIRKMTFQTFSTCYRTHDLGERPTR